MVQDPLYYGVSTETAGYVQDTLDISQYWQLGPLPIKLVTPALLLPLCSHLSNTVTQHYKVCRSGQIRYSPEHGFNFDFTFPPSYFYQFQPPQLHLAHSDKMNLALFKIKTQLSANFPPGGTTERRIKIYVSCRMEGGYRNC